MLFLWLLSYLRGKCDKPRIGTPIAIEKHGGFTYLMFGFEKDKILTVTTGETEMEEKWILPGRR